MEKLLTGLIILALILGLYAVAIFVLQLALNLVLPLFGVGTISYLQSGAILLISNMLFGASRAKKS